MAGGGITKSWRLVADGTQAAREFDKTGDSGKRMEERVRSGAAGMGAGLKAVDAAAHEAQQGVEGLASRAGPLGNVLRSIGPLGIAAAAGIGALTLAFHEAEQATNFFGTLQGAAIRAHVGVETLQEYRAAMLALGQDARTADADLTRLNIKLGELRTGRGGDIIAAAQDLGIDDDEVRSWANVDEAIRSIARHLVEINPASRATLADKFGLAEMLPLLERGEEGIDRLIHEAHEAGIVIDEDIVKSGFEANHQWDVAAGGIEASMHRIGLAGASMSVDLLQWLNQLISKTADWLEQWSEIERRSQHGLGLSLDSISAERARIRQSFPDASLTGGDATRGAHQGNVPNAPRDFSLEGARDRWAYLNQQAQEIVDELNHRAAASHGGEGGTTRDPHLIRPVPTAPEIRALETFIERLRDEVAAREDLARLALQYPKDSAQELTARRALEETMQQLNDARTQGVIGSDEELAALQASAQANYDAADAARANTAAIQARATAAREYETFQRSIESPLDRARREEGELHKRFDGVATDAEIARGVRAIREEYDKLAQSQYEASLQGQLLHGVIEGQIQSIEDLERVIFSMLADAVLREVFTGGVNGQGGLAGFGSRVLDRIGDTITGGQDGWAGVSGAFGGNRDVDALGQSAKQAAADLAESLSPSVAESAVKLGLSSAASSAETNAKSTSTIALGVMTKSVLAAAEAAAQFAAASKGGGAKDIVSSLFQFATSGGGKGGGIDIGGKGGGGLKIELSNQSGFALAAVDAGMKSSPDGTQALQVTLRRQINADFGGGHYDAVMKRFGASPQRTRRG